MRCLSTILFALMALVLPMAGVQKYFCTMNMEFVDGAECPVKEKDCCEKDQHHSKPDCFLSAKLIPNAEMLQPVHIPSADGLWSVLTFSVANPLPAGMAADVSPEKDRAPPDGLRLFLAQERLLI